MAHGINQGIGRGMVVTIAASLLLSALGSIHAFSVFVAPMEQQFGVGRSQVSLTFSLALVSLTLAVLLGHRFYGRWSAARFVGGAAALASGGLILAGMANGLPVVWIGYSLFFGAANGLAYGFGMQIAAQANPGREGVAMGTVTACYALGAVLAPAPFEMLIDMGGPRAAMFGLAGVVVLVGFAASLLLYQTGARYVGPSEMVGNAVVSMRWVGLVWLGFFGAVMAGLMVVGHASGIDALLRPGGAAWVAPALLAACNLLGSLVGGRAADRVPARLSLTAVPLMTFVVLVLLALFGGPAVVLLCIGGVGFAYGAAIAAYPSVIAKTVGPEASAMVYGRVFTAWGAAGLTGPWLAGVLFDWTGAYFVALLVAAGMAMVSVIAAGIVFRSANTKQG